MKKALHDTVFRRYIRMPYGHLLDCADENGEGMIPSAEECKDFLPSLLGWTTPIADCAMFGGLYVYALSQEYDHTPSEHLKEELHLLIRGLLILCDISSVNGFIARGVAEDGVTHYPLTSDDQIGPWVLGLWRAIHCDALDEEMRQNIKKRLIRTLSGLYQNDWKIPTEFDGINYGSYRAKGWRDCARMLFLAAVAREYGIVSDSEFCTYTKERPEGSFYSRIELVANGYAHDMVYSPTLQQFWINVGAHFSVSELIRLDPQREAEYRLALKLNAMTAISFVRKFDEYRPEEFPSYDHDWRKILPDLKQYTAYEDILAESKRANSLYAAICPVRLHERKTLGQAIFSAWVVIADGERLAADYAYACLDECVRNTDWDKVGQCYAFAAESAMLSYEIRFGKLP